MQISSGSFGKSMNPPISFIFLIVALLLSSASAIAQAKGVQFGYDSRTNGPNRWGNLNPQYKKCAVGKLQSPINILKRLTFYDRNLGRLITDYHPTNATLVNHICNVAMLYEKGGGSLVIEGKNFTLKQMHWHTPSEHQINGVRLAAELHLVHEAEDGSLAVVATLYKLGKEDPFLSKVKDKLAELAKEKYENIQTAQVAVGVINPKHVERRNRKYYRYVGSLTTPPCTENVIWTILGKVRSISKEQVDLLESPLDRSYKVNARPVQSLNGRRVEMYHELELPVKHRKHEKKMKKN